MLITLYLLTNASLIAASRRLFARWFNPIALHAGVFSLVVLANSEMPFVRKPGAMAWLSLFSAAGTFALGAWAGLESGRQVGSWPAARHRAGEGARAYSTIAGAFCVALLSYYIVFLRKNPTIIREAFSGSILRSFYILYSLYYRTDFWRLPFVESLLMIAAVFAGRADGMRERLSPATYLLGFSGMVSMVLSGTRTILIVSTLLYAAARSVIRRRDAARVRAPKKPRRWPTIVVLSVVVIGFLTVTVGRSLFGLKDIGADIGGSRAWLLPFAGSIALMDRHMTDPPDEIRAGEGAYTLRPVLRPLCGIDTAAEDCEASYPRIQPWYSMPYSWNTSTYLGDVYVDYGYLGVLLVPFLLAFFASFFLERASAGSAVAGIVAPFVLTCVAMSFHFLLTYAGVFWVALLMSVGLVISLRSTLTLRSVQPNAVPL